MDEKAALWFKAIHNDDVTTVNRMYLDGFPVETVDENKRTAMVAACSRGSLAVLKWMIVLGGNKFAKDDTGWNLLTTAIFFGQSKVIKVLFETKLLEPGQPLMSLGKEVFLASGETLEPLLKYCTWKESDIEVLIESYIKAKNYSAAKVLADALTSNAARARALKIAYGQLDPKAVKVLKNAGAPTIFLSAAICHAKRFTKFFKLTETAALMSWLALGLAGAMLLLYILVKIAERY